MSARKAPRRPKARPQFRTSEPALPIAGLPMPKPCPFCGDPDNVSIVLETRENGRYVAHVECIGCGAQAPKHGADSEGDDPTSYGVVKEAARLWNCRGNLGYGRKDGES